jgi:hypothetical protein
MNTNDSITTVDAAALATVHGGDGISRDDVVKFGEAAVPAFVQGGSSYLGAQFGGPPGAVVGTAFGAGVNSTGLSKDVGGALFGGAYDVVQGTGDIFNNVVWGTPMPNR